jgi:hypothetical protein
MRVLDSIQFKLGIRIRKQMIIVATIMALAQMILDLAIVVVVVVVVIIIITMKDNMKFRVGCSAIPLHGMRWHLLLIGRVFMDHDHMT